MTVKARTTHTDTAGAQTPATPAVSSYTIVTNLTAQMQIIVADEDGTRQARPLILRPYETITLKAADLAAWRNDANLRACIEQGSVALTESPVKSRLMPREPDNNLDAYEKSVLTIIVYGDPDEAKRLITFDIPEPLRGEWGAYMRTNYATILTLAHTWLTRWGPPEPLKERLSLIEKRLALLKQASLDALN